MHVCFDLCVCCFCSVFKRFQTLDPDSVERDKNAKLNRETILKLPELQVYICIWVFLLWTFRSFRSFASRLINYAKKEFWLHCKYMPVITVTTDLQYLDTFILFKCTGSSVSVIIRTEFIKKCLFNHLI